MEEDMKILEKKLKQWKPYKNIKFPTPIEREISKENRAIENLINKYRELRQEVAKHEMQAGKLNQNMVSALEEAFKYRLEIKDLEKKNGEQEKIIELMAEAIHDYKDWTDMVCNIVDCTNTPHCNAETKEQELNCIIDYFRKKAKGG